MEDHEQLEREISLCTIISPLFKTVLLNSVTTLLGEEISLADGSVLSIQSSIPPSPEGIRY